MNLEVEKFPGEIRMLREIQSKVNQAITSGESDIDHFIDEVIDLNEDFMECNQEFIKYTEAFKSGITNL